MTRSISRLSAGQCSSSFGWRPRPVGMTFWSLYWSRRPTATRITGTCLMAIVVIPLWPSFTLSLLSSSITWLSLTCTSLSSWRILIKRIRRKRLGSWKRIWRCFIPNGQSMYPIHSIAVLFFFISQLPLHIFYGVESKTDFWYCSWEYMRGICILTCTTCIRCCSENTLLYPWERYDLHFPSQYFLFCVCSCIRIQTLHFFECL